ncbi:unnamed protein product [Allacma fusca]|uniref:Transmembrane protein n=1 Tax=Allacma fusca TaxID=39272 RepID=A0A8J2LNP4_9HEXA|nr:unnamed protein product [Allacma fusca]
MGQSCQSASSTNGKKSTNGNNNVSLRPFSRPHNLSIWLRLYIYGLHGYFIEVSFTAVFDFVLNRDWKLAGCSSIWSLGIFGSYGLAMEKLSFYLRRKNVPIWIRGIMYVLMTYAWEFTSGTILTYLNACPWDYSEFSYNIGGVITLEYAPLWLMGALISERILIGRLEQLHWADIKSEESTVKDETTKKIKAK